jgi:hypothetical protein
MYRYKVPFLFVLKSEVVSYHTSLSLYHMCRLMTLKELKSVRLSSKLRITNSTSMSLFNWGFVTIVYRGWKEPVYPVIEDSHGHHRSSVPR